MIYSKTCNWGQPLDTFARIIKLHVGTQAFTLHVIKAWFKAQFWASHVREISSLLIARKKNSRSQKSNSRAPRLFKLLKEIFRKSTLICQDFCNYLHFFHVCVYMKKNSDLKFCVKTKVYVFCSFFLPHHWATLWQVKNTISQKKSEVNILCSEQTNSIRKKQASSIRKVTI